MGGVKQQLKLDMEQRTGSRLGKAYDKAVYCHPASLTYMQTTSLVKTLMLGKIEGRRKRGQWRMRWLDGITDSIDMNLSKPWVRVKVMEAWHASVHGVAKS